MARKKEKSIFGSIINGKGNKRDGGSIFNAITAGKGKRRDGGSIFSAITGGKGKKKGDKSIFSSIMGGEKKGKGHGIFSIDTGSIFGGILSGFNSRIMADYLDDGSSNFSGDYGEMEKYLTNNYMNPKDRNAILFYLMHFDDSSKVRNILSQMHGVIGGGRANWAYKQWVKYRSDPKFRDVFGYMGSEGQNPRAVAAIIANYRSSKVPKGIYWFLQAAFRESFGPMIPHQLSQLGTPPGWSDDFVIVEDE